MIKNTTPPISWLVSAINQLVSWFNRYWFNAVLLYLAMHVLFRNNLSIQVNMKDPGTAIAVASSQPVSLLGSATAARLIPPLNVSLLPGAAKTPVSNKQVAAPKPALVETPDPANEEPAFSMANLTPILSPDYAARKGIPKRVVEQKLAICQEYIASYSPVAINEMKEYGIPASITLAQGLLESNAGDSRLARESNNHFGIKCRTKCRGCTCRNYTDDDIYDMFRVFPSPWESFREHSLLLNSARYKHLHQLSRRDYKAWAHGLKQAGYATDKRYAEKLIAIIETLDLHDYDS